MKTDKEYSRAAFPGPAFDECGNMNKHDTGMTLRDYFAAAALQGMLARTGSHPPGGHAKDAQGYAGYAFVVADAMLKERAK